MDSGPSKRKGSLHDWSDAGSPAPDDAVGDAVGNEFVGARDDGRVDGHVDDVAPSDEVLLDAMQKTNILRLVSAAPNLVTAWCARLVCDIPRNGRDALDLAGKLPLALKALECRALSRLAGYMGATTAPCSTSPAGFWNLWR